MLERTDLDTPRYVQNYQVKHSDPFFLSYFTSGLQKFTVRIFFIFFYFDDLGIESDSQFFFFFNIFIMKTWDSRILREKP